MHIPRNLGKFYRRVKKLKFIGLDDISEFGGKKLEEIIFEIEKISSRLSGYKYSIFTPSGRAAIETLLYTLKLKKDDEVITQAYGCYDVTNLIGKYAQLSFCDINLKNINFDLPEVKKVISSKTKVIMPVNIYGLHSPSTDLIKFCRKKKILLVNDFAHDLGEFIRKRKALCDIGIFSFSKGLAASAGGLIMTNDYKIYIKLKDSSAKIFKNEKHEFSSVIRSLGLKLIARYPERNLAVDLGFVLTRLASRKDYLSNLDEREAALCLSQLKKIDTIAHEYLNKFNKTLDFTSSSTRIKTLQIEKERYPIRVPIFFNKPLSYSGVLDRLYSKGCFEPSLNYSEDYIKALRLSNKKVINSDFAKDHLIVVGVENLNDDDIKEVLYELEEIAKENEKV